MVPFDMFYFLIAAIDDSNEEGLDNKCVVQSKPNLDDDGDDGTSCPICFEPWSSTGDHRVLTLSIPYQTGKRNAHLHTHSYSDIFP